MTNQFLADILNEKKRAEVKFPDWPTDIVHAISIMTEEAGEALQAANNARWHNGDIKAVRTELIQTGAMVLRALENLP